MDVHGGGTLPGFLGLLAAYVGVTLLAFGTAYYRYCRRLDVA
jgi:hypothetical protein